MKIIPIVCLLFFLGPISVFGQVNEPLDPITHYMFLYAYPKPKGDNKLPREVVITEIHEDNAQTHLLFKSLNLKNRTIERMKKTMSNYEKFVDFNTDIQVSEIKSLAKRKELMEYWKENHIVIHEVDINFEKATGKEHTGDNSY